MNIFFAAMESPNKKEFKNIDSYFDQEYFDRTGKKINILLSYYYLNSDIEGEILKHKKYANNIIIDSGAFSLFGKSDEINDLTAKFRATLEYSKDFLEENVFFVCSMDFREDVEGFTENYTEYLNLREIYPDIVPVIHSLYPNPNDEIAAYSYHKPPVIGIGKIKGKRSKDNRPALINSINRIKQTSMCHLLAITDFNTIKDLPKFDSCDSRSWLQDSYYGKIFFNYVDAAGSYVERLLYFDENYNGDLDGETKGKEIPFSQFEKNYKKECELFLSEIETNLKINRDNLFSPKKEYYRKMCNIYYYLKMEEYINKVVYENK